LELLKLLEVLLWRIRLVMNIKTFISKHNALVAIRTPNTFNAFNTAYTVLTISALIAVFTVAAFYARFTILTPITITTI
jgi:hypothetical protein